MNIILLINQTLIDAENIRQKNLELRNSKNNNLDENINYYYYYYDWIETKVLQTPIPDYRKLVVGLILVPYLIIIKKLSYDESYRIIY